jgi:non-ribosomal peptide synthetase component F
MPGLVAVDDGQRRLTYAGLNERVNRAAHALAGLGVGRGDRVAVLSENRIEYVGSSWQRPSSVPSPRARTGAWPRPSCSIA